MLANGDGTFTHVFGTGFTLNGSNNATGGFVTSVQHYDDTNTVLLETVNNLPPGRALDDFQLNISNSIGDTLQLSDTINGGTSSLDVLWGYDGADTFHPGALRPNASGVAFAELVGGVGHDTFTLGAASASQVIVAYYLEEQQGGTNGIVVDLANDTATDTFGGTDTLIGITFVAATSLGDILKGDVTDDIFAPGGGNDEIDGAGGFNTLVYAYVDRLQTDGFSYGAGITVTFTGRNAGRVLDPLGNTDSFTHIQVVLGTRFSDVCNGGSFNEWFAGGQGGDAFNGGPGSDTVDYSFDLLGGGTGGVDVSLLSGIATDGFGDADILSGIENVIGTPFADFLTGNSGANLLDGGAGGADHLNGGAGNDTYYIDSKWDVLIDSSGFDTVISTISKSLANGFENLILLGSAAIAGTGNSAANTLIGNSGKNALKGLGGNDTLTGGLGADALTGGTQKDIFDFNSIKESVKGVSRDKILDFNHAQGDRIDLSTIDAKTHSGGNQGFHFIATHAFTHHDGELRFSGHILQGDVNGDGKADFEILVNALSLAKGDFVL